MTYRVRFVDYAAEYRSLEAEIDAAIKEVLSRGDLILRDQLRRFEENIASFLGVRYGVGVNSGTDALHLSLRAAGLGSGDEVITVSHTFVATVAAIHHTGATPILVDVGHDYNMDMDQLEKAISPRTRAIVPVHLNGRVCDLERLKAIATTHTLVVIEDAAQALGATFGGVKAGSFGLCGCFSFYPAKILGAFGEAGMIVTDNEELAEKVRLLRDHGRKTKNEVVCFGFNSRLDNLHAAMLNVKLRYLPRWIERRREIARLYDQGLSDLPQVKLPPPPDDNGPYFDVYQNYVIRCQERDRLAAHLRESGVEVLISWPIPMHRQKALALDHFHLPETERISREVISLPCYPELSDDKVEYVIQAVHGFYSH